MATTTIFDVVKISELPVVQRMTDGDYLIVNDNDPATGVTESKTILIDDLALGVAERTHLKEIQDVVINSPRGGEILRWNGSEWVNSPEDNSHIILSDLSVRNLLTDPAAPGGKLDYDKRLGIFNFYPANINGPLSQAGNVDESTDSPNDKDTLSWNGTQARWEPAPVVTLSSLNLPSQPGNRRGKIEINGYRIDYTAPDLDDYLLITDFVEEDPVFRSHPAYTIGGSDIDKWNEAYMWGNHAVEGYLKSLSMNGLSDVSASNPNDFDVVSYNAINRTWVSRAPKLLSINGADDVVITAAQDKQILRYNNASQEWKNVDNRLDELVDVDVTAKTHWSVLYYNQTSSKWMPEKVQIIDEIVLGPGLSGGGRPLDVGPVIRVDLVPGTAIDTNNNTINVRTGPGITTTNNQVEVLPSTGILVSNQGVAVRTGQGIGSLNGDVDVLIDDDTIKLNVNNQLYADIPAQDFTNVPVLTGEVDPSGAKVLNSSIGTIDYDSTLLPSVGIISEYEVTFTEPMATSTYDVGLTILNTGEFFLATVKSRTVDGFVVRIRNLDETSLVTTTGFTFRVTG